MVMDRLHVDISGIGQYNMAYIFGNYFEFGGTALGMAVGPVLTSLIAKRNQKSESNLFTLAQWLQIAFITAGFIIALWSKELMGWLISNNELKSGYPIAIIIIMSYVYRPYYWLVVNRLQYHHKTTQLWKISFIAGILNLVLNFIFIPIFGLQAAAITTFAAMMYMGFSGYFLKAFKELKTSYINYRPLQMIAAIISTTIIVYTLKDASYTIKTITTVACMTILIIYTYALRNFFKQDDL
jgi:O-antigen/teichoic acid export membrane protein